MRLSSSSTIKSSKPTISAIVPVVTTYCRLLKIISRNPDLAAAPSPVFDYATPKEWAWSNLKELSSSLWTGMVDIVLEYLVVVSQVFSLYSGVVSGAM